MYCMFLYCTVANVLDCTPKEVLFLWGALSSARLTRQTPAKHPQNSRRTYCTLSYRTCRSEGIGIDSQFQPSREERTSKNTIVTACRFRRNAVRWACKP